MLRKRYELSSDMLLLSERALYIKSLNAIVLADLHIGIEFSAAFKGVYIPEFQYEEMKETIDNLLSNFKVDKLIIVGDFKHEFSGKTKQELREIVDMIEFIESFGVDLILVRGNHDNFLRGFLDKLGVRFEDNYHIEDSYIFAHGHKDLDLSALPGKSIILAHEHPSILLLDEVGAKAKIPVFLVGHLSGKQAIVLPAFSPLAQGSEVNVLGATELLSPILRRANIDEFFVYPVLSKGILPPTQLSKIRIYLNNPI